MEEEIKKAEDRISAIKKEEFKPHMSKEEFKPKNKKFSAWKIATIVLAVLLVASIFTSGFKSMNGTGAAVAGSMSSDKVADKAVKFINENLLRPGMNASVTSTEAVSGLYLVKLDISGTPIDSYVTKDGKYLFPQAIDLDIELPEVTTPDEVATTATETPKTDKPKVEMYVMSFCPYGQQAETGLIDAVKLLNNNINFEPHFVIYGNYQGGSADYCIENGKYCSMHGIQELNEDVRQLCVWKYNNDKFWDYVMAINKACKSNDVDKCWENIAKGQDIDVEKIKSCQKDEAVTLLGNEVKLNTANKVSGSPTIIINGVKYSGGRSPENFKTGICGAFKTGPSECSTVLSTAGASNTAAGCGT